MLIEKNIINNDDQESPGDRLNKILDQCGFQPGRARTSGFHSFLEKNEDWPLSLSAVRSWFGKTSPPMKKIVPIIELLETHYGFKGHYDLKQIEAWWKVGGTYPFQEKATLNQSVRPSVESSKEIARKLEFLVPSFILDEAGDDFNNFSSAELDKIKDFTMTFAMAFGDPKVNTCPEKYVRMAINYMLNNIDK